MATTATPSSNRHQNVYPGTPSSEKRRLKGLWSRNEWWCNCSPRARAVARNVTSNTPNKGKGFWVCRLPPNEGCGFFLFFEEARLREISLSGEAPDAATPSKGGPSLTQTRLTDNGFQFLGRRRSDPGLSQTEEAGDDGDGAAAVGHAAAEPVVSSSQPEAGSSAGRDKGKGKAVDVGDGGYEPLTPGTSGGVKRKFDDAFDDDDDDELDSDDERQLATMTDRSVEKFLREQAYNIHGAPPDCEEEILASSSKPVARALFPHAQNSAAAEVEDDVLATSSKPVARTLFPQAQGSTAKRTKTVSFEESEPFPPTPSRTSHARGSQSSQAETSSQTSPPSSMDNASTFPSSILAATQQDEDEDHDGGGHDDVAEQIMGLLKTQPVEPSVLDSVRKLLLTSARRTKGIAMGRDSARAALNEKKNKIARLQERIAALENKERVLNSQITHIKASLMKMYEDN